MEHRPPTPQGPVAPGSALRCAALTIAWNVVEGVVAITAGIAAGSIALVGFGFDYGREWP